MHKELNLALTLLKYSKTCLKGPLKNKQNSGMKPDLYSTENSLDADQLDC